MGYIFRYIVCSYAMIYMYILIQGRPGRGDHSGKKHSLPNKGFLSHGKHSPAGFEGPTKWAPFHLRNPTQKWCKERLVTRLGNSHWLSEILMFLSRMGAQLRAP